MELLEVSLENVITIGLIVVLTLMLWSLVMSFFGGMGMGDAADEASEP